jgi:hypothetical protein
MKMRSKRDQRPLLTQEAPILSDQMDPQSIDANEEDFLESNGQKKRPWRRLFGKSNSNNNNKQNGNRSSHGTSREVNRRPSASQSSSSDSGDDYTQKRERPSKNHHQQQHHHKGQGLSPRAHSDKRDDGTESSQNTSNHLNEILDHNEEDTSSPIDFCKSSMNNSKKSSIVTLTSPATTTTTTSPTTKSAVTQQHRNHISPIQMAAVTMAPASIQSNTTRSASRRTTSSRSSALVQQVRQNRSLSSLNTATAITNKILSRPFGREHVLMTVQMVRLDNAKESLLV